MCLRSMQFRGGGGSYTHCVLPWCTHDSHASKSRSWGSSHVRHTSCRMLWHAVRERVGGGGGGQVGVVHVLQMRSPLPRIAARGGNAW